MTAESQLQRERGMLIVGVIIGGIFGIVGGIWNSYFIEWYKSISPNRTPDWTILFFGATIGMVIFTAILVYWAKKLLR